MNVSAATTSPLPRAMLTLIPLQRVAARLRVGSALPFNVHDARGGLLLPRGQMVADEAMRERLLAHGAGIDADELREVQVRLDSQRAAVESGFFERWLRLQGRLRTLLGEPAAPDFLKRLRDCAAVIASLAEASPDRLIFSVMRHEHSRHYENYGSAHALHVAGLCALLARRAGWPADRLQNLLGAALSMNLSIIELQGQMAVRGGIPSAAQRRSIERHPEDSVALLRQAGLGLAIDDEEWLTAVTQHHEDESGGGYPHRLQNPSEMAQMLRFVDIFLAKHAGRADRSPVPPQQAARDLYMASAGHPVAAMLIKEMGIFPPGSFVRLACGEVAIVVRRGAHASMPLVCAIASAQGDPLATPRRRDTAQPEFAITGSLADKAVKVVVEAERLYAAAA